MTSPSRLAAMSTLLAVAIVSGCSEKKDQVPAPPRPVRVIDIQPQDIPLASAEGTGRIAARHTADVGFLVAGRLIDMPATVGQMVKVGDLLARIDATDFQNRVTAAQSQVTAAQAAVDQAAPQEARIKKLLDDGFSTRQQYEAALQALQGAQAQLQGAHANLKLAQDQLKYTQLLVPTNGVITATAGNVGQVVAAGQMIAQISQEGDRDAVFAIAPQQVGYAEIGMPVKVWLQSDPAQVTEGKVRQIAPNADPITGTYEVKVSLPNAPAALRLGAIVVGRAEVPGNNPLVRIPATALLQTGKDPQVWVVSVPGDTVVRKPVKVLRYDSDWVVLSDGVKKGDLVVTAGVNSLADGQKVSLQKAAAQ